MNKLEKALWAYAPYGLKIRLSNVPDYDVFSLKGVVDGTLHLTLRTSTIYRQSFEKAIPILQPLSNLTKPIKHNEGEFVPAQRLVEIGIERGYIKDNAPSQPIQCRIVQKPFGKVLKVDKLGQWLLMLSFDEHERASHWVIEKLLEWKFDIFNLLESGEAVSVTETFNPYE